MMTSSSESESEDERNTLDICKFNRILQESLQTSSITKLTILKDSLSKKLVLIDKIINLAKKKNDLSKQKQLLLQELK